MQEAEKDAKEREIAETQQQLRKLRKEVIFII